MWRIRLCLHTLRKEDRSLHLFTPQQIFQMRLHIANSILTDTCPLLYQREQSPTPDPPTPVTTPVYSQTLLRMAPLDSTDTTRPTSQPHTFATSAPNKPKRGLPSNTSKLARQTPLSNPPHHPKPTATTLPMPPHTHAPHCHSKQSTAPFIDNNALASTCQTTQPLQEHKRGPGRPKKIPKTTDQRPFIFNTVNPSPPAP